MVAIKSVNLKQYFYDKTDADAKFATKLELPTAYTHPAYTSVANGLYKITVDSTGHVSATTAVTAADLPAHTHGSITSDGKIGTASGKIITTGTGGTLQASDSITTSQISDFPSIPTSTSDLTNDGDGTTGVTYVKSDDSRLSDARTPTSHTQATSTITNAAALDNILPGESTTLTLTDQAKINAAINTAIGTLKGVNFIEITSNKGTASSSTMGKLYLVAEDNKIGVYYTEEDNGTYSWSKFEDIILEDVSIAWNDITNKPDSFTPASHTHGNLTNDGKVGTESGKPLITTTGGAVTAGAFGTTAGTFAEGNHTHDMTSAIDTEIEAYLDAIVTAYS